MTVVCSKFGTCKLLKHAMVLIIPFPYHSWPEGIRDEIGDPSYGLYQVGAVSQAMQLTNSMQSSVLKPPPVTIVIFTDSSGLRS